MNETRENSWLFLIQGMQRRGMVAFDDDDTDKRNRNWYAEQLYGDKYDTIRTEYQAEKIEDIGVDLEFYW